MSIFDKDYFFLCPSIGDEIPMLVADEGTSKKSYDSEVMPFGSKPFIFYNSWWKVNKELWNKIITPMDPPPDVLFDGTDLVVCDRIAEELADLEIPNLAIQPAIFIDHNDEWHEYYWFLTFTKVFDCWDRERSQYYPEPLPYSEPPVYGVSTYSLNDSVLQETPLSERQLFKLGGVLIKMIIAHKSIVDLFRVKGVDIVPIADYGINYPSTDWGK